MNLRDIKKDIDYVVGAFIDDCALFITLQKNIEDEKAYALVEEGIELYNDLRDKVNTPKGKKGEYYHNLRKELLEKTDALYEKLSETVKENIKK